MTQTGTQTHNSWTLQLSATAIIFYITIINRPGVAGAVLQTALWAVLQTALSFIKWLSEPFPPDIQNIIASKPLELESWNFDRIFTPYHVSCVMCHVSPLTCHVSPVTCIFFSFSLFYTQNWKKVVELVSGGSVINGAYPVKFSSVPPLLFYSLWGGGGLLSQSYSVQLCLPLTATIRSAGRSKVFFDRVRPAAW